MDRDRRVRRVEPRWCDGLGRPEAAAKAAERHGEVALCFALSRSTEKEADKEIGFLVFIVQTN